MLPCTTAAKSPSYHPIRCGSTRCKYASPESICPKNIIKKSLCYKDISANGVSVKSKLLRDTIHLSFTTQGVFVDDSSMQSNLTLACADSSKPYSSFADGTIGLANTPLSLPSQLFSLHSISRNLAICLPSKPGQDSGRGDLFIGGGPYYSAPFPKDISTLFASTPLLANPAGEYFIDVKSVVVSGKTVPLDVSILKKSTKVCTVVPYTILHSSIYKALVIAFSEASKAVKAPSVKPFNSCFSSKGLRAPVIDLVLGGGAKWRIYGSNSLVKVNKNVVCLGFLDGGVNMKIAMVLGGFQMEDNFVEFDLKASKLSFTSSLLPHNISCNHPTRLF